MFARKAAGILALVSTALVCNGASAQAGCWYPNEAKAAQLVQLNMKLMVGALHCRDKTPQVVETFNRFVTAHGALLQANHNILKNHFEREEPDYGGGSRAYRDFLTLAGNQHSATPAARDIGDCDSIIALSRMASGLPEGGLLMLAESLTKAPASGPCRPSQYTFEEAPLPGSDIAQSIEDRDSWEPLDPIADSTASAPLTAAGADSAAEKKVLAQAPEDVPASGALDTAAEASGTPAISQAPNGDAMQTAVAALQAATAALQMAMQSAGTQPSPAPKQDDAPAAAAPSPTS
jgi:hypothetical protein